jgi:phosphoadenosine phosphosulfate reductase
MSVVMSDLEPAQSISAESTESHDQLAQLNAELERLSAPERVARALADLPGEHAMSSSFGAQAAVLLHMATQLRADLPVILIDTTFLFAETYQFIDALSTRLKLNVIRAKPALPWPESQLAALASLADPRAQADAIEQYNQLHKVAPMLDTLEDLGIQTWLAGLRRQQSRSRAQLPFVSLVSQTLRSGRQVQRYKVHPLADWTDRDVYRYLQHYQLPYHPLWEQGYVSIGDRYLTQALQPGMAEADTRFFGVKRECGLHAELARF